MVGLAMGRMAYWTVVCDVVRIRCGKCKGRIEGIVGEFEHVERVLADIERQNVTFQLKWAGLAHVRRIVGALRSGGFRVALASVRHGLMNEVCSDKREYGSIGSLLEPEGRNNEAVELRVTIKGVDGAYPVEPPAAWHGWDEKAPCLLDVWQQFSPGFVVLVTYDPIDDSRGDSRQGPGEGHGDAVLGSMPGVHPSPVTCHAGFSAHGVYATLTCQEEACVLLRVAPIRCGKCVARVTSAMLCVTGVAAVHVRKAALQAVAIVRNVTDPESKRAVEDALVSKLSSEYSVSVVREMDVPETAGVDPVGLSLLATNGELAKERCSGMDGVVAASTGDDARAVPLHNGAGDIGVTVRLTLTVSNMVCAACSSKVTRLIIAAPGVIGARVSHALGTAQVDCGDGGKGRWSVEADAALLERLAEAGYPSAVLQREACGSDEGGDSEFVTLRLEVPAGTEQRMAERIDGVISVVFNAVRESDRSVCTIKYDLAVATAKDIFVALERSVRHLGEVRVLSSGKGVVVGEEKLMSEIKETKDCLRRFQISAAFGIPLFLLSFVLNNIHAFEDEVLKRELGDHIFLGTIFLTLLGVGAFLSPASRYFLVRGWTAFRRQSFDMNVLIAASCSIAFLYGLVAFVVFTALGDARGGFAGAHYFHVAGVLIMFMTGGKYMANRAVSSTTAVLKALLGVVAHDVMVVGCKTSDVVEMCSRVKSAALTWRMADRKKQLESGTATSLKAICDEIRAKSSCGEGLSIDNTTMERTHVELVSIGSVVLVRAGCSVDVQGIVLQGRSLVDESILTGEPFSVAKSPGDLVYAGTINGSEGSLFVCVTALAAETVVASIADSMVESMSSSADDPVQAVVDKISGKFVEAILILSAIVFIVWMSVLPSHDDLIPMIASVPVSPFVGAITFLVATLAVACPCALGLAVPTALVVLSNLCGRHSILISSSSVARKCRDITSFVFDKTGTLTCAEIDVVQVVDAHVSGAVPGATPVITSLTLRQSLRAIMLRSEHAIADAIVRYCSKKLDVETVSETDRRGDEHCIESANDSSADGAVVVVIEFEGLVGKGVRGVVKDGDGRQYQIICGNAELMNDFDVVVGGNVHDAVVRAQHDGSGVVYVAVDGTLRAGLVLRDRIRDEASHLVAWLDARGIDSFVMTGDTRPVAMHVARQVGIREENVFANLKPGDKERLVRRLRDAGRASMASSSSSWRLSSGRRASISRPLLSRSMRTGSEPSSCGMSVALSSPEASSLAPDAAMVGALEVDSDGRMDTALEAMRGRRERRRLRPMNAVGMMGDGLNDAQALTVADVGFAIGDRSEITRSAADIVLLEQNMRLVAVALHAANGVYSIIRENLVWAFIYNLISIPLAAGVAWPWGVRLTPVVAGIVMSLSSFSVVINSLRLYRTKLPVLQRTDGAQEACPAYP